MNRFLALAVIMMQTAYYLQHYWKNDGLYLRSMVRYFSVLYVRCNAS